MDIESWFKEKGSYADGLALYKLVPGCNKHILAKLALESSRNFLTLKYELKMAQGKASSVTLPVKEVVAPQAAEQPKKEPLLQVIIEKATEAQFEKETMAMYPPELHGIYRNRISDFYRACEIKFKLNALQPDDEETALEIIRELDTLWTNIDRYWEILHHWRDHNRIMPLDESEDFTGLNGIQLVKRRNQLETSKCKRSKTIAAMQIEVDAAPEDRQKLNLLNRKKEQLQQIETDLNKVRLLLQKEEE